MAPKSAAHKKSRNQVLFIAGMWVLLAILLYTNHHQGWAILMIFVPIGLFIGAARLMAKNERKISKVGIKGPMGVQCPKCGGTQFQAKRSAAGKVGLGLLAPKTMVRCVTCATQYTRG